LTLALRKGGMSVLGTLALVGVFSPDEAQAYGERGVGARTWYFPEGYTGEGFEEWILIYNPPPEFGGHGYQVMPKIYLFGNDGYIGRWDCRSIQPGERRTVYINEVAAFYGYSGDVSVVVDERTGEGLPYLCERALYFNYRGQITGGSQTFGYQEGATE